VVSIFTAHTPLFCLAAYGKCSSDASNQGQCTDEDDMHMVGNFAEGEFNRVQFKAWIKI
jgi:hypothetical protein